MDYTISDMKRDEAAAAAEISKSLLKECWSERDFLDSLEKDYTCMVSAQCDGKVIGYAVVYCAADQGELESIALKKEYQGQGIAAKMLAFVCMRAREKGVESVTLEVREHNAPALRLYEKFGFLELGRRKNFYRDPAEDALICGCELQDIHL